MQLKIKTCGVIGNPITHSLSPKIHAQFAKQFEFNLDYQKYLVETDKLNSFVRSFFKKGGTGLNVTLPFKQQIINVVDELSDAAKICQSVNTLSINTQGKIKGDTTDGEGLIHDFNRLGYEFKNKKILLIGAGGASISVIYSLLNQGSKLTILNRTSSKIKDIAAQFSEQGTVELFNKDNNVKYDGVILAISEYCDSLFEQVISSLKKEAFVYDLNYAERAEKAHLYFKQKGYSRFSDGYGMLLGQAAKSFEIWHGVLPKL
jgi:shikimate dehydrogenase